MPKAKDLMTTHLISVDPDDSVETAISLMIKHRVSGLPVTDASGELLGVISEFDLLDLVWDPNTGRDKVHDYMTAEAYSADVEEDIETVAKRFHDLSIRRLPVLEGNRLVGIISRHDLLRYVMHARGKVAPVVPQPLSPISAGFPSPAGG